MNPQAQVLRRSRLTLVLLGALFFAPFIGAWVVYNYFPDLRPSGTTNHGQLIAPARPVPALTLVAGDGQPVAPFKEKWSLVVLGGDHCDAACSERLVMVRQVRLALGKNLNRLQRIYIAPSEAARIEAEDSLAKDHPGLSVLADHGEPGARAADFFTPPEPLTLYLVDPNGNWLMVYAGAVEPKDLLDDLKKLMRLSSIG